MEVASRERIMRVEASGPEREDHHVRTGAASQRPRPRPGGGPTPILAATILLSTLAGAPVVRGQEPGCHPAFGGSATFPVLTNFGTNALIDINRDGAVDLLTGESFLLGDGAGSFAAAQPLEGAPELCFDVIGRDFDGDGSLDLALATFHHDQRLTLLFGEGPGGGSGPAFASPVRLATVAAPWHIASGDFDENGLPDLVAVSFGAFDIGLLLNQGGRSFSSKLVRIGQPSHGVTTSDFDADGHADIAIAIGDRAFLLFGRGDGSFDGPFQAILRGSGRNFAMHRLRSGDLDGDGHAELLAVGSGGGSEHGGVIIYDGMTIQRGSALPTSAAIELDLSSAGRFLEISDLNSDGRLDLVALSAGAHGLLEVFTAGGPLGSRFEFTRETPVETALGGREGVLGVGAIDGDAAIDLVVTTEGTHRGQVFLNVGGCDRLTAERGDVNRDGTIDLSDAVTILDYLFQGGLARCSAAGHVNGDDRLDLSDAIYILSYLYLGGSAPLGEPIVACGSPDVETAP